MVNLGTTEKTYSAGNSEMKRKLDALENDLAFWRGQDKEVPIIVNDECWLLELQVPEAPDVEDNRYEPPGLSSPSTGPTLVGKEGFAAMKQFWEVEVGQQ